MRLGSDAARVVAYRRCRGNPAFSRQDGSGRERTASPSRSCSTRSTQRVPWAADPAASEPNLSIPVRIPRIRRFRDGKRLQRRTERTEADVRNGRIIIDLSKIEPLLTVPDRVCEIRHARAASGGQRLRTRRRTTRGAARTGLRASARHCEGGAHLAGGPGVKIRCVREARFGPLPTC